MQVRHGQEKRVVVVVDEDGDDDETARRNNNHGNGVRVPYCVYRPLFLPAVQVKNVLNVLGCCWSFI